MVDVDMKSKKESSVFGQLREEMDDWLQRVRSPQSNGPYRIFLISPADEIITYTL